MTKSIRSATAFAAIFALSACGSGGTEETADTAVKTSETESAGTVDDTAEDTAEDRVAKGKSAFAICSACHNLAPGASAKAGPNLYGILGKQAGSAQGFNYSAALSASGITWTEEELDAFIANPRQKIPGTSMGAGAISDAAKRSAIIAYIKDASGG